MLLKLSLSGMKSKRKEYIILFMGLIMSIAIFYMFETLAIDKSFLEGSTPYEFMGIVFHAGTVLLAIITVVYILYANAFLLTLRQKEYGMYMMLGAKKNKIAQFMFIETIVIAAITLVVGILIGTGLAKGVSTLLMSRLGLEGGNFEALYPQSLLITVLFFIVLFVIAGIINVIKLTRLTVLQLLNGTETSERVVISTSKKVIEGLLAVILLAIGYYCMIDLKKLQVAGMFIALVTISLGTYFFFKTLLPLLIVRLQKTPHFNDRNINRFTLAQLRFRVSDLTKVLSLVTMLIALAVGSMAVALVFNNNMLEASSGTTAYDSIIKNPTVAEKNILAKMDTTEKAIYRFKNKGDISYFLQSDLEKTPLNYSKYDENGAEVLKVKQKIKTNRSLYEDDSMSEWSNAISQLETEREVKIIAQRDFDKINSKTENVVTTVLKDFTANSKELAALDKITADRYPGKEIYSKYSAYNMMRGMFSGIIFMGLFLGFAFLAMMASCLMFKILVGAPSDIKRYDMLNKIGVKRKLLFKSLNYELVLIFIFPALLASVHVLVGMKMFEFFLSLNVYFKIWIPFAIFIVIYGIYYLITVSLYQNVVLPKKKGKSN